jgi:uncharacterized protein
MKNAEFWIQNLDLMPHSEGGFYRELYRSSIEIDAGGLPKSFKDSRRLCTSIYYLLRSGEKSKLHRLKSDELWYYHIGSALKIIMIDHEGNKHTKLLGPNFDKAEHFNILIPAGTIFGAEVTDKDSYSLFSCLVSPGFEYADFEMFDKDDLVQAYPKHTEIIEKYT